MLSAATARRPAGLRSATASGGPVRTSAARSVMPPTAARPGAGSHRPGCGRVPAAHRRGWPVRRARRCRCRHRGWRVPTAGRPSGTGCGSRRSGRRPRLPCTVTDTSAPWACLRALVSPSCTIRYALRPTASRHGRRVGHPTVQLDPGPGLPRLGDQLGQVGQRRLGPLRRVVGLRSSSAGSARSTPITARSSSSAWWALSRITPAARAISSAGRSGRSSNAPGVQAHQRDAVGEHVVHLPGDPEAFLPAGLRELCRARPAGPVRAATGRAGGGPGRTCPTPATVAKKTTLSAACHHGVDVSEPDQHGRDAGGRGPGRDQADHREAGGAPPR